MSRKKFAEELGATCTNWNFAWSYINHEKKFVLFGAWKHLVSGSYELILSEEWEFSSSGRRNNGYRSSLRHLEYVEEGGYDLFTFEQVASAPDKNEGKAKVKSFERELRLRTLHYDGGNHYAVIDDTADLPRDLPSSDRKLELVEGKRIEVTLTRYERSPEARLACIKHFGCFCQICEFDFLEEYGELGNGFIHVHHLVPISKRETAYTVNPLKDLIPVCPNCHAMLHRNGETRQPDEIAALLDEAKQC